MHGYWFGGYSWIWMLVMVASWLVLIGGTVWLIVWAVRRSSSGGWGGTGSSSTQANPATAKDIAQMRYARGEINREEYQQLLDDLSR